MSLLPGEAHVMSLLLGEAYVMFCCQARPTSRSVGLGLRHVPVTRRGPRHVPVTRRGLRHVLLPG